MIGSSRAGDESTEISNQDYVVVGTEQFAISGNIEPLKGGCRTDRTVVQIEAIDIEEGRGSCLAGYLFCEFSEFSISLFNCCPLSEDVSAV